MVETTIYKQKYMKKKPEITRILLIIALGLGVLLISLYLTRESKIDQTQPDHFIDFSDLDVKVVPKK